jgi:hypothetical protein
MYERLEIHSELQKRVNEVIHKVQSLHFDSQSEASLRVYGYDVYATSQVIDHLINQITQRNDQAEYEGISNEVILIVVLNDLPIHPRVKVAIYNKWELIPVAPQTEGLDCKYIDLDQQPLDVLQYVLRDDLYEIFIALKSSKDLIQFRNILNQLQNNSSLFYEYDLVLLNLLEYLVGLRMDLSRAEVFLENIGTKLCSMSTNQKCA